MYLSLLLIPLFFGFAGDDSWQTTFCNIALVNSLDVLHCNKLHDTLTFEAGNNVSIELFNSTKIVKISSSGGNQPNEKYCATGEVLKNYNATTSNFDCITDITSVGNGTGDNLGNHIATQFLDINNNYISMSKNTTVVPIPSANSLNLFVESTATRPILKATGESGVTYEISGDQISVCRNNSGSLMVKGNVVYLLNGNIDRAIVGLAKSDSLSTLPVFAILLEDINNSSNGLCLNVGLIKNIDTSMFSSEGDSVWLSSTVAGAYSPIKPDIPVNYPQRLGVVQNKGTTDGVIYFSPTAVRGDFEGSNVNHFDLGDNTTGKKSLTFHNGFDMMLSTQPTANFEQKLQNKSGTIALLSDVVATDTNTAQIISAGGTSLFKSRDNATQNTIKGLTTTKGISLTANTNDINISTNFQVNTKSCSASNFFSAFDNSTGVLTCSVPTGSGSSPRGGYLVANWHQSSTKTNIGTSFVDVYTGANSNGKAQFIDTDVFTQVRLQIEWNKIGTGTQSCQVVDIASGTNILITLTVVSGSNDSGFVSIPSSPNLLNVEKNYKIQCKSTTSADDPVFESAVIWIK